MNEKKEKEKILNIVKKNPKIATEELSKQLNIDTVDTILYLQELEREGKVRRC